VTGKRKGRTRGSREGGGCKGVAARRLTENHYLRTQGLKAGKKNINRYLFPIRSGTIEKLLKKKVAKDVEGLTKRGGKRLRDGRSGGYREGPGEKHQIETR